MGYGCWGAEDHDREALGLNNLLADAVAGELTTERDEAEEDRSVGSEKALAAAMEAVRIWMPGAPSGTRPPTSSTARAADAGRAPAAATRRAFGETSAASH